MITSAANPRVQAARALRDRRAREAQRLLLVDGVREVERALDAGASVAEVFVAAEPRDPGAPALLDRLARSGIPVVRLAGPAEERIAYGDRRSEAVAVVRMPSTDLGRLGAILDVAGDPLVVVVEDPEKPGNLGAIARTADGAGAVALVAATARAAPADPWNPNAVRASLGTVLSLPVAVAPSDATLAWLRGRGLRIVAARVQAAADYRDADLRGPVAIVVGSEALGLTDAWAAADIAGVRLPMLGRADSLNVSVAAGILLYEARRQRDAEPSGTG